MHTSDDNIHDNKVHEAIVGPICGRQEPGGPHVGPYELCYLGAIVWQLCV